jgi:hypothetical protein
MLTFAQEANTHRVALLIGAIDLVDVIAWADSQIEVSEVPHNRLIDVSLGGSQSASAIAFLLIDLARNTKDPTSIKRAFGLLADRIRRKQIDIQAAIINCYRFLQDEHLLYEDKFMLFINLEDDLSLIRDGIFGSDKLPQVEADLLAGLDKLAAGENAG